MPVRNTGTGDLSQSDHGSKSDTRPLIQPGSSSSGPEIGHFLCFSIPFHCPDRPHFPNMPFKKHLRCFCHGFLFLIFSLSRKSQCSPLTVSPVLCKGVPSYWCLLQLWAQMEFMAFWVVFTTVLKAWQMPSQKLLLVCFFPRRHTLLSYCHMRDGSLTGCELLLLYL